MKSRNAGFALIELLVVVICIGILLCLVLPAIQAADDKANQAKCINRMKQLTLATIVHENATRTFPLATDASAYKLGGEGRAQAGVGEGAAAAGFSWTVPILPYLEEMILYSKIRAASKNFEQRPFHTANLLSGDGKLHVASQKLPVLRCPSTSAKETAQAEAYAKVAGGAAASSYICLVGTNFHPKGGDVVANGVIVHKTATQQKGLKVRDIADGTSKTVILGETREENYSSWLDGQATWGTGMKETAVLGESDATGNPVEGAVGLKRGTDGYPTVTDNAHALNWGSVGTQKLPYLKDNSPGATPRNWGPSSEHAGNIVVHGFVDGHVITLSDSTDATVYYRMITRRGGEPTEEP